MQRQPHNNSQHVLAIVNRQSHGNGNEDLHHQVLGAFAKTSELPCDVWRSEDNSIVLASNYPNCILESKHWVVLCAGFTYRYREAFAFDISISQCSEDKTSNCTTLDSFALTLLRFCERHDTSQDSTQFKDRIGQCLKRCSGYFSVYLVRKGDQAQFWAWNDPFGFMPVYYCHNKSTNYILSSHWDCLVPALSSMTLDLDIVAEYIILGTTLGGGGIDVGFDRTFTKGIKNLSPGYACHIFPISGELRMKLSRYIKCYGACEEILDRNDLEELGKEESFGPRNSNFTPSIRGVKVNHNVKKAKSSSPIVESDNDMHKLLFHFILDCVKESREYIARAALTGGGDTRLLLACILRVDHQNQLEREKYSLHDFDPITFQTHSKQLTDWRIARHLAKTYQLKHKRIQPASATTNRNPFWHKNETLLSNLHDQTPMRRKYKMGWLPQRRKTDEAVEYTLHGRFGTEFIGCLCFNKSPLDIRTIDELETYRPEASSLFDAVFCSSSSRSAIRNPIDTLHDRFQRLNIDKDRIELERRKGTLEAFTNNYTFDVGYAFQLQLYSRSSLSDIYKGLRGGSWFSMPIAQFSRNAITPFLDNRLLQWMACKVLAHQKEEPYELYGRLYDSDLIPQALTHIPSNNKLLCRHSRIPNAQKKPEAKMRPHLPAFVAEDDYTKKQPSSRTRALRSLEERFDPIFWKGALAIFDIAPVDIDHECIVGDSRSEVRAFLDHIGDADNACRLSGRLQSFLLWYERRFLVHSV